jgi:hypothetical protein
MPTIRFAKSTSSCIGRWGSPIRGIFLKIIAENEVSGSSAKEKRDKMSRVGLWVP